MINKKLILSTIGGFEQLGLTGKSSDMKGPAPRTGLELMVRMKHLNKESLLSSVLSLL